MSTDRDAQDALPEQALPAEVRAFVEKLKAERLDLLEQLQKRQSLAHSLADELSEPEDDAGLGAAQRDADRLEPVLQRTARRVDAIQRVLDRALQGQLMRCDRCGDSIGLERLRAIPETTLCVSCARELELQARA
jgi:DnaK suppressor protein